MVMLASLSKASITVNPSMDGNARTSSTMLVSTWQPALSVMVKSMHTSVQGSMSNGTEIEAMDSSTPVLGQPHNRH